MTKPYQYRNPLGGAYQITSPWGQRVDPTDPDGNHQSHNGIDFGAPQGTPILAVRNGRVIHVGDTKDGYGKRIEIQHDDGTISRYGHADSIVAKLGQEIAAGDHIGGVGSTGKSTGNHLHFELLKDGQAINPHGLFDPKHGVANAPAYDPKALAVVAPQAPVQATDMNYGANAEPQAPVPIFQAQGNPMDILAKYHVLPSNTANFQSFKSWGSLV